MKTVLTYGTFDLLHVGHVNILERLRELGDRLIVGVSTDEFNALKGKQSIYSYAERARIVGALQCVDLVIPEHNWEQKVQDISLHQVDIFGIGEDWKGKFDALAAQCDVIYLPRTENISTTALKRTLSQIDDESVSRIKDGLDGVMELVKALKS